MQAPARKTPPTTTGTVTLQNGGLQPKTNQGGVSLDPNQPNRLPGMIKQATYIQQQQDGYSPPVTPTSATDGTAFAGQSRGIIKFRIQLLCSPDRWKCCVHPGNACTPFRLHP